MTALDPTGLPPDAARTAERAERGLRGPRVLHLRPVGERVPSGERGRLPPARPGVRQLDLPHRPAASWPARQQGARVPQPGHVHGAPAGDEPHGVRGRRARRRRHRRSPPRRQLLRLGTALGRVHRDRDGRLRGGPVVDPRRQLADLRWGPVHERPFRAGLLDAGAGRIRAARVS